MENQPLEPIIAGEVVTRDLTDYFKYVKKIGKGSYGSVKLYESKIDKQKYVIKEIDTYKKSEKVKELIKQEVDLLMQLKQFKHPNIM